MTTTPQERRSYGIALVSIFAALGFLIFGIVSKTQQNSALQQLSTAQAEKSFAAEQMATAETNAEEAKNRATISRANELAAYSVAMRGEDFQRSMLLGIEAYRIDENVRTKSALFDNARADPQIHLFLSGHTGALYVAEFNSDGSVLAAGGYDGITLWDVKTGQIIRKIKWNVDFVIYLAFSHDGSVLASVSNDMRIALWNVSTGKLLEKQPPVEKRYVYVGSVSFSPIGNIVAVGSCTFLDPILPCDIDQTLLWDYQSGEIAELINIGAPSISFSPDGNRLAFEKKKDNSVVLWDVKNHRIDKEWIAEYVVGENTFMFFTNGNLLAGNQIWNIQTGQPVSTPLPVSYKTAFSPDGNTLFSVYNGNISQSDIKTGDERIFAQIADQYDLEILAVHPDGNILAVSGKSRNDLILVSNYQPYQPLGKLLKESELPEFADTDLGKVIYSPDKSIEVSIDSKDDVIILSNVQSGSKIRTLDTEGAHLWEIITISPDGKTLAAMESLDLILWDVESGQPIGKPLNIKGQGMRFTPDGNWLVTMNQGQYILWDTNPQSWIEQTCRRVGRNFTILEWERYFPGEEYRATCPQWPLSH